MKNFLILLLSVVTLFVVACSDNSTNPTNANISMVATLSNSSVTPTMNIKQRSLQSQIDEIKINSVRILISNIKMHSENDDSTTIKAGPVVYSANSDEQSYEFVNEEIPIGSFNKIKFEFHRFTPNELPEYQDDTTFGDFATPERYTVIIEGEVITANDTTSFTYNSTITANLTFNYEPPITIEENEPIVIDFVFDTEYVFLDKGEILDPNDPKSRPHIDNNIKSAIRSNKK